MAGLGKYKKGAKFTLRSGNKPSFQQMGSSPANLNNFGIGQGGSPYNKNKEGDEEVEDKTVETDKNTVRNTGTEAEPKEGAKAGDSKEPAWKKALKVGTTLLSGGIQGVYGGAKENPKISWGKWSQEELDQSAADKILKEKGPDLPETPEQKAARELKEKNEKEITVNP